MERGDKALVWRVWLVWEAASRSMFASYPGFEHGRLAVVSERARPPEAARPRVHQYTCTPVPNGQWADT